MLNKLTFDVQDVVNIAALVAFIVFFIYACQQVPQ